MESLTLPGAFSSQQMVFAASEDLSATPEKPSVSMKNLKHQKA
jgi:hypothetical protein